MKKKEIFLTDFFYINRLTTNRLMVPLNIGYIGAYTKKLFDKDVNITLFKDANAMLEKLKTTKPDVVGMSFYYWNTNLNDYVVKKLRELYNKDVVIAYGGPSIDSIREEHEKLFTRFPEVDLFIHGEGEGELGFAKLIERVLTQPKEKIFDTPIECSFFNRKGDYVLGPHTTLQLDEIPSPYLNGSLDEFLALEYKPLLQITRTCPYSCNFCVAGKDRAKLRSFPIDQAKAEVDYIAKWNKNNPHVILNLAELNFGINKQDPEIAAYIKKVSDEVGYPRSVYFYSDKRFTDTSKQVVSALGNINRDGLVFSLQSDNLETLKNIKRKNLPDEDVEAGIAWAREKNIPVTTEMIFGLPNETYETMIELLNKSVRQGFDSIILHNLFIMEGVELNREENKDQYQMKTMHRLLGSNYTKINGTFIAEYESLVVENKWFDWNDYLSIRAINLLFFSVFQGDYYKFFFQFAKEKGILLATFFDKFMNPDLSQDWPAEYLNFVNDFKKGAAEELFPTLEEMYADAKKVYEINNDVGDPVRLNPYYYSRLMYSANDWINEVLKKHLTLILGQLDDQTEEIVDKILVLCNEQIVNLVKPNTNKSLMTTNFDFSQWRKAKYLKPLNSYFLKNKKTIDLTLHPNQSAKFSAFCEQYKNFNNKDFGFVAVESIFPRTDLFYNVNIS